MARFMLQVGQRRATGTTTATAPLRQNIESIATSMSNNIDISTLTTEQLAALRVQLKSTTKSDHGDVSKRNAVIDPLLQVKQGEEFVHTTADILTALQTQGVAPKELGTENRKWWLKAIQTRKQKLEKMVSDGKLVHAPGTVGYKVSATGFTLTPERVIEWLNTADKSQLAQVLQAVGLVAQTPKRK